MSRDGRSDRLEALFHEALRQDPSDRAAFLDQLSADDAPLIDDLRALLAADAAPTHPGLEPPMRAATKSTVARLLRERGVRPVSIRTPGAAPDEPAVPTSDDPAARYALDREIGRGGMGVVYRGHDRELGRRVAVKTLRPEHATDAQALWRFVSEAQIGGQLQHPGVVPVYDLGLRDDRVYFAMKLIEGKTFAQHLAERPHPAHDRRRVLGIFEQICQTVAYAHACDVIHRDLKPGNVMVGGFGEVQVADWGMAKVLTDDGPSDIPSDTEITPLTALDSVHGAVLGTPAYMPPEQARGEVERLDARSDVFALGAMLAEILTGQPAWPGTSDVALAAAQAGDDSALRRRLETVEADPALIHLATRCLAIDPALRPDHAGEVAGEVAAYLGDVERRAEEARTEAAVERTRAIAARRTQRLGLALAATLVVAVVGGSAITWKLNRDQRLRTRRATAAFDDAWQDSTERTLLAEAAGVEVLAWTRAATSAERLRTAAASSDLADERRQQASDWISRTRRGALDAEASRGRTSRETALVARLEELAIPVAPAALALADERREDARARDAEYQRAFLAFGVDPEKPNAVRRLRETEVHADLAAALDTWAETRRTAGGSLKETERLRDLAIQLDADPFRRRAREARRTSDARTALLALIEEMPESSPASARVLATFLRQAGATREGVDLLRAAHARHPDDFHLVLLLAMHLEAGTRFDEAARYYTAATVLRPQNPQARYRLGVSLMLAGDLLPACNTYERAIQLAPDFAEARVTWGGLLVATRQTPRALEVLRACIDDGMELAELSTNYASALHQAGEREEALVWLDHALTLDDSVQQTHAVKGAILKELRRLDEAVPVLQRAIELGPTHWDSWNRLAQAQHHRGKLDEARQLLDQVLRRHPDDALAPKLAATLARDEERYDDEGTSWMRAWSQRPSQLTLLANAAAAFRRAGNLRQAEETLSQLAERDPTSRIVWTSLADVRFEGRDAVAAMRAIDRAVELASRDSSLPASERAALEQQREVIADRAEFDAWMLELLDEPDDGLPEEVIQAADLAYALGRFEDAARAYWIALDEDEFVVEDQPNVPHRWQAAAAVLATGLPDTTLDGDPLDDTGRLERALSWLEAELSFREDDGLPAGLSESLDAWWADSRLARLRDGAALRNLPEAIRDRCRALWDGWSALASK